MAAHDFIARTPSLDKAQKKRLKNGTLFGIELVDSVTRLCAMNLLLHGIGGDAGLGNPAYNEGAVGRVPSRGDSEDQLPVVTRDALAGKHGEYDIVLANPPFGKKSSVTIVNEAGESSKESLIINQDDCPLKRSRRVIKRKSRLRASRVANWASTSKCEPHGRGARVCAMHHPQHVGVKRGCRESTSFSCRSSRCGWSATQPRSVPHTLLRLPTGIFYAQGGPSRTGHQANVLFFDRKPAQEKPWTQKLWIYDLRTNPAFHTQGKHAEAK